MRIRQLFDRNKRIESNHSLERERRLLFAVLVSGVTRVVTVLAMLVTVPIVHKFLTMESFGVWMTLTSLTLLVQFADLGVGNGLVTIISDHRGRDEQSEIIAAVSSAMVILLIISIGFLFLSLLVICNVDWSKAFRVKTISIDSLFWSMTIFCSCLALTIPASLGQKIQWGFQESYLANLWQMLGSVISIVLVLFAVKSSLGLPGLVFAMAGGPLIALTLSTIQQLGFRRPWLRPHFGVQYRRMTGPILRSGAAWASYQGLLFLATGTDGIFVTALFGAKEMGTYGTMLRMMSGLSIALLLMVPLWPAFAEALSRRDFVWAKRTSQRALLGCALIGIGAGCFLLFAGQWMSKIWVGTTVEPPMALVIAFSAWVFVYNVFSGVSALMANAVFMRKMMVVTTIGSLAAVALKIPFGKAFGVPGICWASVAGIGFSCAAGTYIIRNALSQGDAAAPQPAP